MRSSDATIPHEKGYDDMDTPEEEADKNEERLPKRSKKDTKAYEQDHHQNSINKERDSGGTQAKNCEPRSNPSGSGQHTIAQPFFINGIRSNDSHSQVPRMLTLVFQIEKSSTGFLVQREFLLAASSTKDGEDVYSGSFAQDEQVIRALQHSLFCEKLFDSIQREVSSNTRVISRTVGSSICQSTQRYEMWRLLHLNCPRVRYHFPIPFAGQFPWSCTHTTRQRWMHRRYCC